MNQANTKFNIKEIRQDFPILETVTYLDSAATSQKPTQVIERMREFMLHENGTVRRGLYDLSIKSTQAFDQVREQVRSFINAKSADEIIFTRGTTESLNLLASSLCQMLEKEAGEFEILVSGLEHHANIVPWQLQAERCNASIKVIPVLDDGSLDQAEFGKLISSGQVKIMSLGHISNALGTINPIQKMIQEAKKHGVICVIDGAQGITHASVDVQDLDADFYAFSAHKLYGPTGVGVLYGKHELLDKMPPYHGGGEMIEKVSFEKTTYAKPPFKFEAGTPAIAEVIGLGAALDYLNSFQFSDLIAHEQELSNYCRTELKQIPGLKIIGDNDNKASIHSFVFDDIEAFDIGTIINQHGVAIRTGHHCAQPLMARFGLSSTSRASIAFYNSHEDIEKFIQALKESVKIFR